MICTFTALSFRQSIEVVGLGATVFLVRAFPWCLKICYTGSESVFQLQPTPGLIPATTDPPLPGSQFRVDFESFLGRFRLEKDSKLTPWEGGVGDGGEESGGGL